MLLSRTSDAQTALSSDIFVGCRLLTGAILAHELMHAWLRLKGIKTQFDLYLGISTSKYT
jgi:hypothetical protein